MHMPISTINDTIWAEVSAPPRTTSLRVRPYYVARPRGVMLVGLLALLGAAVLDAAWKRTTFEAAILIGCCALAFYLKGLDRSIVLSRTSQFANHLSEALCWGTAAGMLLLWSFPVLGSRPAPAVAGLLMSGLLIVAMRPVLRRLVTRKKLVEGMLIVGNGSLAVKLHQALAACDPHSGQQPGGGLLQFPAGPTEAGGLTDLSRLAGILQRDRISRVIVAEQDAPSRTRLAAALVPPRLSGLRVNDAVDFYEQFFGKIWIDALSSERFVYNSGFRHSKFSAFLKRAFDVAFACLLLLLAAPGLLLLAIAIRLDSKGPVLFRQLRVGFHGKTFLIYKFRSMRMDAESDTGPAWATEGDQRATRVGRVLRKFHLDELPQAINVLRGEMSLVGPRPERPYFVDRLEQAIPFYGLRHFVKPGITGWAQVKYRYGASVQDSLEKLQYDLYYAKHKSLLRDIEILLKTVELVLFGKGR